MLFAVALSGPAHWELLTRGRALDNQLYVASVSPAREEGADYVAWGHTTVADPWGQVALKMGHQEQVATQRRKSCKEKLNIQYLNILIFFYK